MMHGAERHIGHNGVLRVLCHRQPAAAFDGVQPRGAIRQGTRQHDSDHPAAEARCGRAKQRIDRWPRQVLARAAAQQDMAVVYQQVHARHGNIDIAALYRLAVAGGHHR